MLICAAKTDAANYTQHKWIMVCCLWRCIDGYSRKILWLRASSINHNPAVIASYYLAAVEEYGVYPAHMHTDCGTENVTIAAIQASVTRQTSSHVYGSSPGNQRTKCRWSFWWRHSFTSEEFQSSLPSDNDLLLFAGFATFAWHSYNIYMTFSRP